MAGILTQEVESENQNLGIGIVTQARFIRETVAMLDAPADAAPASPTPAAQTFAQDTAAKSHGTGAADPQGR